MRRLANWPIALIVAQRGFLFSWAPVALGTGIGLYFLRMTEPARPALWLCLGAGLFALWTARRAGAAFGPVLTALALIVAGLGLAGLRAHQVAGPQLDFRYYGPVEGRIVGIDRSASDAVRLTLDRVVLARMDPDDIPRRVRVSLHGTQGFATPQPGATILLTGHLSAPGGAVEPGGFDFRRHAWFKRLGAVGYTRNPMVLLENPGAGQWVFKTRMALSERVRARLPGEAGAFAAAVMSGDRSAMGQDALQDLRDTNLAHLLAISGLHMGLLAGVVFAALRLGLSLSPAARNHWPVKKLAAAGALIAAFFYLLLSGGNVATIRAFIMAAVALTAVMLDRRALSLRAVAIAALIVLTLWPEALLSPGFQMSFAATTALVAVFEQITRHDLMARLPRWSRPLASLVISSAVAGLATAPVGMAHFNQISSYGLLANLVSVPVMGLIVVPMAVLSAVLMPLGLDFLALAVMGLGLDWILFVADGIAGWQGATRAIHAPAPLVLPLLALGGLTLCLWQGRGRLAGALPMALAALLWSGAQRPGLLISDTGTLVGVMTETGRALSRPRGSGFIAQNWLENDGWPGTQEAAAGLWPGTVDNRVATAQFGVYEVIHLQGKRAARGFTRCTGNQIVVSSSDEARPLGPCRVFDPKSLRDTGSVAIWLGPEAKIETAASLSGQRLWHGPARHNRPDARAVTRRKP